MKTILKNNRQKHRIQKSLLFAVLSLITAAVLTIFYFYTYQDFTEHDYTLVYISTLVYSIPIFFIGVYVYISLKEYYKRIDNDYLKAQEIAAKRQEQFLLHSQKQMQEQMSTAFAHFTKLELLLKKKQNGRCQKVLYTAYFLFSGNPL